MGSFLRPAACDVALDFDALHAAGHELGHGGLVAVPHGADLGALALHLAAFMADESCGRCTPCRVGSRRAGPEPRRLHLAQQFRKAGGQVGAPFGVQ